MREQGDGAVQVVFRIALRDHLEILHRRLEVTEVNLGDAATVERVGLFVARRDRAIVAGARLRVVAFVEVELGELLEVADRGVFLDDRLELGDPLPSSKRVERLPQQPEIGQHFHRDIDERAEGSEKDDDPEPDRVRATADEMDDR